MAWSVTVHRDLGELVRSQLIPNAAVAFALLAALAFAFVFGAAAGDPPLGANSLEFIERKRHFVGMFSSAGVFLLVLAGWFARLWRVYAKARSSLAMLLAIVAIGFEMWLYW